MIVSTGNTQIRNLVQLKKKAKERTAQDVFLVEGPKMFGEVPRDRLEQVYVSHSFLADEENRRLLDKGKPALVGFDRKIEIDSRFLADIKRADIQQRSYRDWAEMILILHGTADEIVPIEASRAFAEENGIAFEPVEGADHRFQNPKHMDDAISRIAAFFGMR